MAKDKQDDDLAPPPFLKRDKSDPEKVDRVLRETSGKTKEWVAGKNGTVEMHQSFSGKPAAVNPPDVTESLKEQIKDDSTAAVIVGTGRTPEPVVTVAKPKRKRKPKPPVDEGVKRTVSRGIVMSDREVKENVEALDTPTRRTRADAKPKAAVKSETKVRPTTKAQRRGALGLAKVMAKAFGGKAVATPEGAAVVAAPKAKRVKPPAESKLKKPKATKDKTAKHFLVASLMDRKNGVSRAEILEATGWTSVNVLKQAELAGVPCIIKGNRGKYRYFTKRK